MGILYQGQLPVARPAVDPYADQGAHGAGVAFGQALPGILGAVTNALSSAPTNRVATAVAPALAAAGQLPVAASNAASGIADFFRGVNNDPSAAAAAAPTLAKAVVQAVAKPAAVAQTKTADTPAAAATSGKEPTSFDISKQFMKGIADKQGGQLSLGQILAASQAASAVGPHYGYRGNYKDDIASDQKQFADALLSKHLADANKITDPAAAAKAAQAAIDDHDQRMQILMGMAPTMEQQMQMMQQHNQAQN